MGKKTSCTGIVTRGNLDGIVCAAVFLERFPEGEVTFISSPPSAAEAAARHDGTGRLFVADVPLTEELAAALDSDPAIILVDHHPACRDHPQAVVDRTRSAAGALHAYLGASPLLDGAVALADMYERAESALLSKADRKLGRERLEYEVMVLDFAWRYNVEDDTFRLLAARELAAGRWPSESEAIAQRFRAVMDSDRWNRAVQGVRERLEVRGSLALLDLRRGRPSFHGFGALALTEAARERGCKYAMLVHDSKGGSIASLRACGGTGIDLGQFIEEFAREHGTEGGGHRASAGVRIPRHAADVLIDRLAAAVS
ncbi:MAG: hypothetical protein SA339_07450 [Methanomassiliicoccus sp.]|nr:hypothetical protein [Methanomassiliicoccus sp.]